MIINMKTVAEGIQKASKKDKLKKEIIYIDGLKTGFKGANTLLELIEKEKTNIKKHGKTLDHYKTHLDYLTKSIREYISQWDNVKLGDQVNYRGGQ